MARSGGVARRGLPTFQAAAATALPRHSSLRIRPNSDPLPLSVFIETPGATAQYIYIRTVRSQFHLFSGTFVSFSGWSRAEIKCTVHVALPKRSINQFKLDKQSRQQALRAYCPNVYTMSCGVRCISTRRSKRWGLGSQNRLKQTLKEHLYFHSFMFL